MKKIQPEWDLIQAAQMRMFFAHFGVSKDTTEAAVKVRTGTPLNQSLCRSAADGSLALLRPLVSPPRTASKIIRCDRWSVAQEGL